MSQTGGGFEEAGMAKALKSAAGVKDDAAAALARGANEYA